jgi:hypothetical protein
MAPLFLRCNRVTGALDKAPVKPKRRRAGAVQNQVYWLCEGESDFQDCSCELAAVAGRMNLLRTVAVSVWLMVLSGCHTASVDGRIFHPWGAEDAQDFRRIWCHYRHILLVRIEEESWASVGPRRARYHLSGTVVHVYQGDWRVGERISMVHETDSPHADQPPRKVSMLGFVFTDLQSAGEIDVQTGETRTYTEESAAALKRVFPNTAAR